VTWERPRDLSCQRLGRAPDGHVRSLPRDHRDKERLSTTVQSSDQADKECGWDIAGCRPHCAPNGSKSSVKIRGRRSERSPNKNVCRLQYSRARQTDKESTVKTRKLSCAPHTKQLQILPPQPLRSYRIPNSNVFLGRYFVPQSSIRDTLVVVRVWAKAGRRSTSRFGRTSRAGAKANPTSNCHTTSWADPWYHRYCGTSN
jgi:hypothetical protein